MKVGLIGDIHATVKPLQEALAIFDREEVDRILCAGDIAGYGTELPQSLELLRDAGVVSILGNHDVWWLNDAGGQSDPSVINDLRALPVSLNLTLEGKTLHMVHASPPESLMEGIKLLDEDGVMVLGLRNLWCDYLKGYSSDVMVVGHTHQVFAEKMGDMLLVNPGSTLFNHTCAILSLPEMTVEFFSLSGQEPVLSWNWAGGGF